MGGWWRMVGFLRPWGRGTVHVPIMNDQVEGFVRGIQRIPAVHRAALIADFDILQIVIESKVDDGHGKKTQPPGPGHENGSDHDQRHAGGAIEVLLNVQLVLAARDAPIDQGISRRRDDLIVGPAVLARDRLAILGVADESPLTTTAEVMDAGHDVSSLRQGSIVPCCLNKSIDWVATLTSSKKVEGQILRGLVSPHGFGCRVYSSRG